MINYYIKENNHKGDPILVINEGKFSGVEFVFGELTWPSEEDAAKQSKETGMVNIPIKIEVLFSPKEVGTIEELDTNEEFSNVVSTLAQELIDSMIKQWEKVANKEVTKE